MRLTVLGQLAKGLGGGGSAGRVPDTAADPEDEEQAAAINATTVAAQLERVKWFLWHGNVPRALEALDDLEVAVDGLTAPGERGRKLLKARREFEGYIAINRTYIPNYSDRYRHGELISTAFAEATINPVVSQRMVKKQQLRWSESGAHHLWQVRTKVLNEELPETFARWYPGMQTNTKEPLRKAA